MEAGLAEQNEAWPQLGEAVDGPTIAALHLFSQVAGKTAMALLPNFRALIPGTETMAGPYDDERRAKTEWTRLSCCPEKSGCATVRYSIAAETLH
jgi:hypothetical protein